MKIIKSILIILSFCVMNCVNAKSTGQAAQRTSQNVQQVQQRVSQRPSQSQQQIQQRPLSQVQQGALVSQQQQQPAIVTPDQWSAIVVELTSTKIPSNSRIAAIKKLNLTADQRMMLNIMEQNINLNRQIKIRDIQLAREKQRKKGAKGTTGWFTWLWSGVGAYKEMIKDKLDDLDKYPTLKARQEAIDLGIEFTDPKYSDIRIMKQAQNDLKKEFSAETVPAEEQKEQKMINDEIAKLRDEFGFDLSEVLNIEQLRTTDDLTVYVQNLKRGIKDFIMRNITNENATAILKAITSELKRAQSMMDIVNAPVAPSTTGQVSGSTQESQ